MRHIQLLQTQHPTDGIGQRPHQTVIAHIEHRHVLQQPDLRRQTRPQPIVHQYNLVQIRHVPQTRRNTAVELVVRQHNHRHRRVAEVVRDFKREPVVVDEYGVQRLVEQLRRNRAFELVEPDV
ncbi:hypothetical protein MIMGU_mgv1a0164371mg [Erythranthe guttata]|uniref:Uncharacterized protein n=1 Tax=Erythranthe guttata TaxID=4155 RepID=A0A022Q980_ERYGU|nr:hypothetical protein MIMGU_mgv1a0164371mg [Erythranthe guttata]